MKYIISVSKTYKHRGIHQHKFAKKHWFVYWLDEDWDLHCDQVNFLQALFYNTQKWHRKIVYCSNCFTRLRVLTKSKKAKEIEIDCPNCGG